MIIIGIDPDVVKNGIAIWNKIDAILELKSLTFFNLYEFLIAEKENIKIIKIEAGWLNQKSNFRIAKSKGIGEKMAKDVGANHETGRKIVEMCQYLDIEYKLVKPFNKKWGTPSGKISTLQLKEHLDKLKIKLINNKTNQDNRDSALICLYG